VAERAIRIMANGVRLYAILNDSPAASLLWEALPLSGTARVADGEVAFDADLAGSAGPAAAGADTKTGNVLYHARQKRVALVYSPAGAEGAPRRPDPEAQVCGRITGDASRLARVGAGTRVVLTALAD